MSARLTRQAHFGRLVHFRFYDIGKSMTTITINFQKLFPGITYSNQLISHQNISDFCTNYQKMFDGF